MNNMTRLKPVSGREIPYIRLRDFLIKTISRYVSVTMTVL